LDAEISFDGSLGILLLKTDFFDLNKLSRLPDTLERLGLFAAALGDVEPFVGERAAHAVEDFFSDEIADGAFHDAPSGRGAEIDELLRVKERLQLGLDFGVKVFEALAAMADHGGAKGAKSLVADFDRPRDMEFYMCHNKHVKLFTSGVNWQELS